jgi:hypothetical protein
MRIGFSSIYSWRPHAEQLHYLAALARKGGHDVFFLTCDADLPTCYAREQRPRLSGFAHCAICRAGGIRSYDNSGISSIRELTDGTPAVCVDARPWALSSASTLGRFESNEDFIGQDFEAQAERLVPAARAAYSAAMRWIEKERLDAICLFNGRMDATRGILEACRTAGIRCVTVERTWFGDGLHLVPDENCLGLSEIDRMMLGWRDKPLRRDQAQQAANHIASRFLRRNTKEWRAYNVNASFTPWPVANGRARILLTPGSRNETWGHPDWLSAWPEPTAGIDAVMAQLNLGPNDVVLRCHPNWGEKIGNASGHLPEQYYTDWAKSRGIHVIPSRDATSTLGLIESSDAVVVGGGSAALEAAALGKQVIAVSPSVYQRAGFQSNAYTEAQVRCLVLNLHSGESDKMVAAARLSKQALRFCYTMAYRVEQFVEFVRCVTTTKYQYFDGANPQRLIDLIKSGELAPDNAAFAHDESEEGEILEAIRARQWDQLYHAAPSAQTRKPFAVQRRWVYRPVDAIRTHFPRGDL